MRGVWDLRDGAVWVRPRGGSGHVSRRLKWPIDTVWEVWEVLNMALTQSVRPLR